ncbi:MAG TPA: ORF6N domain-containing protein [bacterium]|nr:ORF6N domain-containing protein [bacterium]
MLDSDLAELYNVSTFRLNEQVKRNRDRFPDDFMFQLTDEENRSLISQNAISKKGRGGRRFLPYVFTEQGVAMLSSVLKSKRAAQINIMIMRVFVRLREYLATNKQLSEKMTKFEKKLTEHDKHLVILYTHINNLIEGPKEPKKQRKYGFK